LVSWWWDLDTGYAIPERSGVIRWFVRIENKLEWADSAEELRGKYPNVKASSITFIPSRLEDNPALTKQDPTYESKLEALPLVERERLRWGNWKIKPQAGKVFNRANFKIVDALPTDVPLWVRYWDKAGTEGGGKFTAGVLMGLRKNGRLIIADVERGQWSSGQRENVIRQKAQYDATHLVKYEAWVEQEPGSGGKESAENTIRKTLAGFDAHAERVTGDKLTRARPLSAQAEAENVDLLRGAWNEDFLSEAHSFDGVTGFTDQIDAASGAANKLLLAPRKIKGAVWGR
jgi:predicted phage terminase large subunit-like protein